MPVPLVCVGALIHDGSGRLYLQRRSSSRALYPNCWDIVGGHVEPGESLETTLARELDEETGWRLGRIERALPRISWTGNDGIARVEYDFVVGVRGDLGAPRLETGKHTESRWVPPSGLGLLREHRAVDAGLEGWIAALAGSAADPEPVAPELVGETAALAAVVDSRFRAAMAALPRMGGAEVVRAHGGPAVVGALIEFRTSLSVPGRWVTEPEALAVARYRDPAAFLAALHRAGTPSDHGGPRAGNDGAAGGMLEFGSTGAFRATPAGQEFLRALAAHQAAALPVLWAGQPVEWLVGALEPAVTAAAATGGPAWHAMAPGYHPAGTRAEQVLLDRLSLLRYHRADAHAAAWQAAGLTAAGVADLTGGPREAVETRTNELAATAWAAIDPGVRARLRSALAALPG